MKKRLLASLLSFALIATMLPMSVFATESDGKRRHYNVRYYI